ncbi:uncharacterized protein LOC110433271 [Sorghum bicolor]|nr:uncharacterized protein LOC110433271 [Sorghum bicolor]|eukprot:XP_021310711.1 uncharacterized protein LOC110433271 [Sorghum bicolor]
MEEVEQGQGPEHEQELNAKVLYDVSGAMTSHGRFAIGYGAVRAADVRAAAKENNVTQSNPVSMQMLARQNAELRRENTRLQKENDSVTQQGKVAIDLTVALYRRFGLGHEIPEASLRFASAAAAQGIATGASHVGSESTNDDNAVDGHDEDNLNNTYEAALETENCHSGHHA